MTTGERIDALNSMFSSRGWIDVVEPALVLMIEQYTLQLITSTRPKGKDGDPVLSDEALKNRILAFQWVQDWKKIKATLVEQVEAAQAMKDRTPPVDEGGGPY